MTLAASIISLATAIGTDVKSINTFQGDLSTLTTTAKNSLVSAINELKGVAGAAAVIDDAAIAGELLKTWSADKIISAIATAKSELINGAPALLDTLKELSDAIGADENFAATMSTALGFRVRVDAAQSFDATQQAQGRANIGAASATDVTTLTTNLGDLSTDFYAAYNAAKA